MGKMVGAPGFVSTRESFKRGLGWLQAEGRVDALVNAVWRVILRSSRGNRRASHTISIGQSQMIQGGAVQRQEESTDE